jgi:hypothetical protein
MFDEAEIKAMVGKPKPLTGHWNRLTEEWTNEDYEAQERIIIWQMANPERKNIPDHF